MNFIFNEGLPNSEGNYLLQFIGGDIRTGYYNKDDSHPDERITVIGDDGDESYVSVSQVEGYLTSPNSLIKGLSDYPSVIADLEQDYYQDQQTKKAVQERISLFNAELELDIASKPELRNEGMRKAMKTKTQLESEEYLQLQAELEKAESMERSSLITLERHKREYSVLKLEKEEAIARFSLAEAK